MSPTRSTDQLICVVKLHVGYNQERCRYPSSVPTTVLPTLRYPWYWHRFLSDPRVSLQLDQLSHTVNHTLTLNYSLQRTVKRVLSGHNESCWRAVLPAPRLRNVTWVLLWGKAKAHSERQSLLAHKTRLLCFLSHFQRYNVKNAGKLYIKTLAKGMCQSLFITYSLSMKAIMRSFMCYRSVWLSKQKLRDIRADEASVQTEMTTFWQLKTRWSCLLLTSTVTTLNYRSHWFRLRWNVRLCLHRGDVSHWSKTCSLREELASAC